jgi:anti-sigma factor RsiW
MNCSQAQAQLASLLYGDLTADEAVRVEEHLAACPTCRQVSGALAQVRRLLDVVPAPACPAPPVDLPRLYREAAERQGRRLRRWRRTALVLGGVAAAVAILAVGLRLEVRVEAHQTTVRWGTPPAIVETPPPPPSAPPVPERIVGPAPEIEEQVRILSELVQLLAKDVDERDQRHQEEFTQLQIRLLAIQQQSAQWRLATERDVDALYVAQFGQPKKGKSP